MLYFSSRAFGIPLPIVNATILYQMFNRSKYTQDRFFHSGIKTFFQTKNRMHATFVPCSKFLIIDFFTFSICCFIGSHVVSYLKLLRSPVVAKRRTASQWKVREVALFFNSILRKYFSDRNLPHNPLCWRSNKNVWEGLLSLGCISGHFA